MPGEQSKIVFNTLGFITVSLVALVVSELLFACDPVTRGNSKTAALYHYYSVTGFILYFFDVDKVTALREWYEEFDKWKDPKSLSHNLYRAVSKSTIRLRVTWYAKRMLLLFTFLFVMLLTWDFLDDKIVEYFVAKIAIVLFIIIFLSVLSYYNSFSQCINVENEYFSSYSASGVYKEYIETQSRAISTYLLKKRYKKKPNPKLAYVFKGTDRIIQTRIPKKEVQIAENTNKNFFVSPSNFCKKCRKDMEYFDSENGFCTNCLKTKRKRKKNNA